VCGLRLCTRGGAGHALWTVAGHDDFAAAGCWLLGATVVVVLLLVARGNGGGCAAAGC
jgi:hypothetical protein